MKTDAEAKNVAQNAMSGARRAKDGGLETEVCGVCRAMLIESGVEVRPLEHTARKITCQVCCKRRYGGVCHERIENGVMGLCGRQSDRQWEGFDALGDMAG